MEESVQYSSFHNDKDICINRISIIDYLPQNNIYSRVLRINVNVSRHEKLLQESACQA